MRLTNNAEVPSESGVRVFPYSWITVEAEAEVVVPVESAEQVNPCSLRPFFKQEELQSSFLLQNLKEEKKAFSCI